MSGFSGNQGCSEGQKGIGMRIVVFQERAYFGYLYLLLIFAQPPGKHSCTSQRCEITSQRCCCPRFLENFSSSTFRIQRFEIEGLRSVSKNPSPPAGTTQPTCDLLSYIPNPRGLGILGLGGPVGLVQQLLQE